MSSLQHHMIGRIVLEVDTDQSDKTWELQENLSQLIQQRAMAAMEELFNQWASRDETVRLEELTIELPPIDYRHLDDEFVPKLLEALRQALRDRISKPVSQTHVSGHVSEPPVPADVVTQAPSASAWAGFLHFLEYGRLPWWQQSESLTTWIIRWEATLRSDTDWRTPLKQCLIRVPAARQRLVSQLPEAFLHTLLSQMQPAWTAWPDLLTGAKGLLRSLSSSAILQRGGSVIAPSRSTPALQLNSGTIQHLERQAWLLAFSEIRSNTSVGETFPYDQWIQAWLKELINEIARKNPSAQARILLAKERSVVQPPKHPKLGAVAPVPSRIGGLRGPSVTPVSIEQQVQALIVDSQLANKRSWLTAIDGLVSQQAALARDRADQQNIAADVTDLPVEEGASATAGDFGKGPDIAAGSTVEAISSTTVGGFEWEDERSVSLKDAETIGSADTAEVVSATPASESAIQTPQILDPTDLANQSVISTERASLTPIDDAEDRMQSSEDGAIAPALASQSASPYPFTSPPILKKLTPLAESDPVDQPAALQQADSPVPTTPSLEISQQPTSEQSLEAGRISEEEAAPTPDAYAQDSVNRPTSVSLESEATSLGDVRSEVISLDDVSSESEQSGSEDQAINLQQVDSPERGLSQEANQQPTEALLEPTLLPQPSQSGELGSRDEVSESMPADRSSEEIASTETAAEDMDNRPMSTSGREPSPAQSAELTSEVDSLEMSEIDRSSETVASLEAASVGDDADTVLAINSEEAPLLSQSSEPIELGPETDSSEPAEIGRSPEALISPEATAREDVLSSAVDQSDRSVVSTDSTARDNIPDSPMAPVSTDIPSQQPTTSEQTLASNELPASPAESSTSTSEIGTDEPQTEPPRFIEDSPEMTPPQAVSEPLGDGVLQSQSDSVDVSATLSTAEGAQLPADSTALDRIEPDMSLLDAAAESTLSGTSGTPEQFLDETDNSQSALVDPTPAAGPEAIDETDVGVSSAESAVTLSATPERTREDASASSLSAAENRSAPEALPPENLSETPSASPSEDLDVGQSPDELYLSAPDLLTPEDRSAPEEPTAEALEISSELSAADVSPGPSLDETAFSEASLSTPEDRLTPETQSAESLTEPTLESSTVERGNSQSRNETNVEPSFSPAPTAPDELPNEDLLETLSEPLTEGSELVAPITDGAMEPTSEVVSPTLEEADDSVLPAAAPLTHPLIANPPKRATSANLSPDEMANGIYLNEAGLVLLHPFLTMYFETVGLLAENAFRNEYTQQQAIALLHYLATGETGVPEYELVLPKVLCGWPLDEPVVYDLELPEAMLEEGENLLQAVINYWEVLKNTSPDGLREGFLQRQGKLVCPEQGNWRLRVEQKAIDVLLGRLPWGISIVKLPWMEVMVMVEWA